MGALMKPLVQFGFCCLLAQGVYAEHQGGGTVAGGHAGTVTASHASGHVHGSVRTFGYGRRNGYYGGFYGAYPDPADYAINPPPPSAPGMAIVAPSAAPMAAPAVHPVIHEYGQPEDFGNASGSEGQPILYLIALRDDTIHAAMTYWVQDGTLHYLDTNHKEKQTPLSSVDRDMSARLNRERHVPFNLQ
jgi:hypothetical protein